MALRGRFSSRSEVKTSRKGKSKIQALNKSGLIFKQAYATISPPADYPLEANKFGCVNLLAIRYSAQLIKSNIEFGLLCNLPYSCQLIPFSPPPLT